MVSLASDSKVSEDGGSGGVRWAAEGVGGRLGCSGGTEAGRVLPLRLASRASNLDLAWEASTCLAVRYAWTSPRC